MKRLEIKVSYYSMNCAYTYDEMKGLELLAKFYFGHRVRTSKKPNQML